LRPFLLLHLLLLLSSCSPAPAAEEPSALILSAFEDHRIVAIGENHGHVELHDLILDFLATQEARATIDDIVVEWGNSLYQDLMDRYIVGEPVPRDSVSMARRNTIVSPNTVWDAPIYERFFRNIRDLNQTFPPEHRYRVVLADSPVPWDDVESRQDLQPYFDRASHMAERVRRESLLKGRRSLLLAGGLHVSKLPRRRIRDDGVPMGEVTPLAWLALKHPGSVFVVQSMARAAELGLSPLSTSGDAIAIRLADSDEIALIPANRTTTLKNMDGTTPDVYGSNTLGDIVDAVILWDSTRVTLQDADPSVFADDEYWNALNERSQLLRGRPMDPSLRRN